MLPIDVFVPMQAAGFIVLFALLMFVVQIAAIIWVYSDAQTNSPQSEVLWTLVVFFGGLLGLLLYFIIGRDTSHGGHQSGAQF
ncbi:PLDc N-terminal domain-containing protein [Halopiger djelfimassiliensis]|uniref:PLDc N-terminal domain-containing protein n=1 Tax=Halopiger djelfimassiliensis TaxID=1293047 RepID=UPI0006779A87|nr:PLDc N-terminal domain-containing protein [Halopiger djelfimassiliensis]